MRPDVAGRPAPAPAAIEIAAEPPSSLPDYARVPIAFEVGTVLDVVPAAGGLGGLLLVPRTLPVPYAKDYDADAASRPLGWPARFDVARWGLLAARVGGERMGGAAVVPPGEAGVELLEGRSDLAVLWDLRVAPAARGRGVGAALFRAAERWAAARGAARLKVETQNVNEAACRFYARRGCVLGAVHRFAYPDLPHEAQLLWYKSLDGPAGA